MAIRVDFGTENTQIGTAQIVFRIDHTDDLAGDKFNARCICEKCGMYEVQYSNETH